MKWNCLIFSFFLLLTSCRFPEDPNQTLTHIINSRILIIGYCSTGLNNQIAQYEKKLLDELATRLNAKVISIYDNQEELYRKLQENKIHIVACRIQATSPWHNKIAFTNTYFQEQNQEKNISYVFAVPQGENAWLSYVNNFIFINRKMN